MPRRTDKKSLQRGQQSLISYVQKTRVFVTNSKEHHRFTRVVTNFIVKDVVPVDKQGFRDMISRDVPRFKLVVIATRRVKSKIFY